MTKEEQVEHLKATFDKVQQTMVGKGNDYAKSDRLSNFKEVAAMCGITPQQVCLTLIATKVSRLGSLYMSGKVPDNEPVSDSILDLITYSNLLSMLQNEANQEASKRPQMIIPSPQVTYQTTYPLIHH